MSTHRRCTLCGQPIVLVPSATERAARYGGQPKDYLALFTEHAACTLAKREQYTLELTHRTRGATP